MSVRCLGLLLATAWFAGVIVAQRPPERIPFAPASDGLWRISGSTGSADPHEFILDTGAGITVLSQRLVVKLGGKPAGQYTGFRMTGERLDLQLYTIPELRIGPIVRKQVLVAGWAGLDNLPIDGTTLHLEGIVALDFFRDQPVTLDFEHHQLLFETPDSLAQRRRTETTVPALLDDERGLSFTLFAPFLVGSHPAECEVDTGSQMYVVNLRYMDMLGMQKESEAVKKLEHTSILGTKEVRYQATSSIALEGLPASGLQNVPVLFEDLIYDCNVGTEYWAHRAVTFDIPHKSLIVSGK
jgi:Aspartyl protease